MAFFSRIRFLPFLIFVAVLFLGFRINHFVSLLSGAIEESPFMQLADAANPEDDEEKSTEDETGNKAEDKTDITAGDGAQENQDPAKKDMAAVEAEEEAEVDGVDETKLRPKLYEVEKDDFSIVNEEIIEELMLHKKQLVEKRTELDERFRA